MLENRGLEFVTQLKPEQHLNGGELYADVIANESKRKATAELIVDVKKLDRAMQSELGISFILLSQLITRVFPYLRVKCSKRCDLWRLKLFITLRLEHSFLSSKSHLWIPKGQNQSRRHVKHYFEMCTAFTRQVSLDPTESFSHS
jgi:hypothetical protein